MQFKQTFQTAGYVRPYPLTSEVSLISNSCKTWQLLETISCNQSDRYDAYDQAKTHLHSIMHNRPHQAEY